MIRILFGLTTFVSAFLLFQVQPLLSKRLLPWFGGSPAVWTTCVLFFQSVLFAGYAYAHLSERLLPRRLQVAVHILLLCAACALLPILPGDEWKPADGSQPVLSILAILGTSLGLAYFLLSSTGPLVSAWFSRVFPTRSPYRLYALSNFASLLALLSYPVVVEPTMGLPTQASCWGWGFLIFSAASAVSAIVAARFGSDSLTPSADESDPFASHRELPTGRKWLGWVGLPTFASLAFLATTNVVCQDVAVVPFLWVAPLSLYLLSFIICFDHERWYHRRRYAGALLGLVAVGPLVYVVDPSHAFVYELVVYLGGMFCVCMLCHGELVRMRPAPRHLTAFYLAIAAGGALGGVLVSVVAPLVFSTHYEWIIAAVGAVLLAAAMVMNEDARQWLMDRRKYAIPMAAVALLVAAAVSKELMLGAQSLVWQGRSFYGVITVTETGDEPEARHRLLRNGRITHGMQFLSASKRRLPTSYYGPESGVGQAIAFYRSRGEMRVGVVGLGTGTIATYARPGDVVHFYEINDQVIDVARRLFTYLNDCRGRVEVAAGDARLSLERESPQEFDVLVLDAFSGDAIPTHLLTTEAFDVYHRQLDASGALCIHVSNRYLDLTGVVRRLAERHGYQVVHVDQDEVETQRDRWGVYGSEWMVLSTNAALVAAIDKHVVSPPTEDLRAPLWTDAQTDLFTILK